MSSNTMSQISFWGRDSHMFIQKEAEREQEELKIKNNHKEIEKQNFLRDFKTSQGNFQIGKIEYNLHEIISVTNDILICRGWFEGYRVAVKLIPLKIPGRVNRESATFKDLKDLYHICDRDANSNHIVRVLHMEKDEKMIYVVMESPDHRLIDLSGKKEINKFTIDNVDLIRQIVYGLRDLHSSEIVHRNLQIDAIWVFVTKRSLLVKIADIGIMGHRTCKMIEADPAGKKSGSWQTPHQSIGLLGGQKDDVYSLARVIQCFLCNCSQPNVVKKTIFEGLPPTIYHLLNQMLVDDPYIRPNIVQILEHPYFWSNEKCVQFFIEVSDIAVNNSVFLHVADLVHDGHWRGWKKEIDSNIMRDLENNRTAYMKRQGKKKLSPYNDELVDLLFAIRNCSSHEIVRMGSYFMNKFNRLLIELYKHASVYYRQDRSFHEYLKFE